MGTSTIIDKNGIPIEPGNMIRIHGRYDDHLGIVVAVYTTGLIHYRPIGWQSSPLGTSSDCVTVITDLDQSEKL